jgi:cystathionine beta-lyase/cystathionine gamma-synthase
MRNRVSDRNIKPKKTPIYQTSVFTFDDLNELEAYFEATQQQYMYSRYANPNSDELAERVCQWEHGEYAVVTSSGMSAILTAVLYHCRAGDHVLCAEDIYGGSSTLLNEELSRVGIETTYVPLEHIYNIGPYVQHNTKMLLAETMSNPLLRVLDIRTVAETCHEYGIPLVVDNTFATPVLTRPLVLGADMVLHSVTKYLSGHSDVTAGVLVTNNEQSHKTGSIVRHLGLNLSPFESWLAARGLKTLSLRMKQHCSNALQLAHMLQTHPKVKEVYYPGLGEHPQHKLAKVQGQGLFGGMLTFRIADDAELVNRLMRSLRCFPFAPSLAGVDSSLSHPLTTSHRSLSVNEQQRMGISEGLIRLSAGIEDTEELKRDLKHALDKL